MKTVIAQNQKWIDETFEKLDKKMSKLTFRNRNKFPKHAIDGVYNSEGRTNWWTNGFWGGMNWLMYEATGNEEYRITAERNEDMLDGAFKLFPLLHHDVGFMWHLTAGANYRLTGNNTARLRNLFAATTLASRYEVDGAFIQAWNYPEWDACSIIDTVMNLSLLYWAAEELGRDRFKKIAMKHMDMATTDHIRPNGSTNHIVEHYTDKKGVKKVYGGQGYSETSCWSRGTSWAIYGSVISYIHTKKPEYLEAAKKTSNYFIEQIKKTSYLPLCDFDQPAEPVLYDSSAGMCAACGILELSKLLPEAEGSYYAEEVMKMLKAYDEAGWINMNQNEDGLVMMATGTYPLESRKNDANYEEVLASVHIPIIWGDFFFVELMTKLKGREFFIW